MPRYREPYTLYPRRLNKSGIVVWYYRVYVNEGHRISRSTGKTSKTLARLYCDQLLREGKLIPQKILTLQDWAEERNWFVWDKCEYIRGKLARSPAERPAISRRYADRCRKELLRWILPYHGTLPIEKITPTDCEKLLFSWKNAGLSSKSINNIASTYRTILNEAERLGIISSNPWKKVSPFKPEKKSKGILTLEEAKGSVLYFV